MTKKQTQEIDGDLFNINADELDEVLAGLPSDDSTINLYRVNPTGRSAYIAEFNPREFSLEGVKNTYGGGKFKYVAKSNGTIRQGTFEVDGDPKSGGNPKIGYKRYNEQGKLVFTRSDDPEAIQVGARNEQLQTQNGNVPLMLLLEEIRRLREEMKQPTQSPTTVKKEFLEELLVFKQLFGDDKKSPAEDLSKNVIDLIKQGIEVGQLAENGGSPWMMILEKVLPTVQEAIKAFSVQQSRIPIRSIQSPPLNAITTPAMPEVPLTGFESIADKLRAYLPTFVSAASNNADPDILVDLTFPQISEKDKDAVLRWLESEKWFSDLCTLHPIIQGQVAWWTDYRNSLLLALKNPEDEIQEHDTTE
jgi:hypothetical protein